MRLETELCDKNQDGAYRQLNECQPCNDDVSRPQSAELEVEVVDDVDEDMNDGRPCVQLNVTGQVRKDETKPLCSEIDSWTALSPSTSAAAAVSWNCDERRRLAARSAVAHCQGSQSIDMRQWPNVKPLDLSVTSRTVMTPRDDVTDLRRRVYDDKQCEAR